MKRVRQILMATIVIGVIGAAVYYSFAPRPILVETVAVTRGPLQVSIVEEGKTRVADRFVVSAPVAGTLRRVTLEVGDEVRRGGVVARLRPLRSTVLDGRSRAEASAGVSVAQAALKKAREDVETARSDVAYWQTELPRVEEGVAAGVMASERLDQARAEQRKAKAVLRAAEQQVGVAESEVEAAKVSLEYSNDSGAAASDQIVTVRAPVSGRVLKVYRESESVVQASQPLVEIADPGGLEVEVEVLSSDAVQITPGMRVLLERWGGPQPLEAVVRLIEPVAFTKVSALGVEEQRVLAIVDITSPKEQWPNLGDQYRVEARFVTWERDEVLRVPSSALFRTQDGWAVFAVAEGTAEQRSVQIGQRSGLETEVAGGLTEADQVINHPSDELADGALVDVQ